MKILKIAIVAVFMVVVVVAVRNKILLDRFAKGRHLVEAKLNNTRESAKIVENAVINSYTASMKHLDKTIKLVNINKIFPKSSDKETETNHPKLLFVFSELSCNVCQDEETQFGIEIASEYGPENVMAIVHASNRLYVNNYIRMNQVNFPVYYCEDQSFFDENGIKNTPMVFIISKDNRVIAAHFPIPGHLEYSEPIHRFCYDYFNRNVGVQ